MRFIISNRGNKKIPISKVQKILSKNVIGKYSCKDIVEPGDIVQVCQDEKYDIEKCKRGGSYKVIGVVSTVPNIISNKEDKQILVTLKGRAICKVQGPIHKGDPIISYDNGIGVSKFAPGLASNSSSRIIGISLENIEIEIVKKIEIVVL